MSLEANVLMLTSVKIIHVISLLYYVRKIELYFKPDLRSPSNVLLNIPHKKRESYSQLLSLFGEFECVSVHHSIP